MCINIEVFLSKSWRTALPHNLGHWTWNEYQYIWQFVGTIRFEFAADEHVRVHITTGFHTPSDWLTCLVIKLYCKSFDHNSVCVCVRACVSVCEHMWAMCVRSGVCVIYIALHKYECVCQQWTTTTTTTAEPLVAEPCDCVCNRSEIETERPRERVGTIGEWLFRS